MAYDESLCSDATWVFASFDHLAYCFNSFWGVDGAGESPFANLVSQCLNDYCQSPYPGLGGCGNWSSPTPLEFEVINPNVPNSQIYYLGYSYFNNSQTCPGVNGEVNPDIAGPGIMIAYIMQLIMILYLWIVLRANRLIPTIISFVRQILSKRNHQTPSPPAKTQSRLQALHSNHDAILQAILVEFQEAQCFFMLASQAAILGAKSHNAILQSYTLRGIWANNGVAGMVSSSGILPVLIGMWTLHKLRMNSPWIFFLSVATLVLSEFALYWTPSAPRPGQLMPIEYDQWPSTCGGHAPPLIWCPDESRYAMERLPLIIFWKFLNPFCLAVFALVVLMWFKQLLCKLAHVKVRCEKSFAHGGLSKAVSRMETFLGSKRLMHMTSLMTVVIELLFILSVAVDAFCFALFYLLGVIQWENWTFGQLVAITLWFPVVSKYLYWMMFGTKAYSEARVPPPYHIVRKKDHDDMGDTDTHELQMLPSTESVAYKA